MRPASWVSHCANAMRSPGVGSASTSGTAASIRRRASSLRRPAICTTIRSQVSPGLPASSLSTASSSAVASSNRWYASACRSSAKRSSVVALPAISAAFAAASLGAGSRCTMHAASGAVSASNALAKAASSASVTVCVARICTLPPVAVSIFVAHHWPRTCTKSAQVVTVVEGAPS